MRALSIILFVMPEPGKATRPFGRKLSKTSLRRKGAALPSRSQFGLHTTWWTPRFSAQLAAIFSAPGPPPCSRDHIVVLDLDAVEGAPDRGDVGKVLAAGEGDQGALGQMRGGLAVFTGAEVVAGVDGG